MLIATDPLSLLFIGCFLFGLLFLLVTAVLGNLGHGHIGTHGVSHHVGIHVGGQTPVGGSHVVSHGIAHTVGQGVRTAPSTQQAASHTAQGDSFSVLSYLNPTSVVLFLLGFGFFGYVFHNTAHLILPLTLVFAGVSGIIIAGLMLAMLARVFGDSEGATVQDVSDRTGLLGKVSITIQEGSLGEILYISPGGMRKSIPARSVDGQRLERGQEVVVVNYQNGVAEVDTWERFINEEDTSHIEGDALHEHSGYEDELARLRALLEESDPANTELVIRKELQKE